MDRLMIDYLKNRGNKMKDQDFMEKFQDFMSEYRRNSMRGRTRRDSFSSPSMMDRMDNIERQDWNDDFMDSYNSDDSYFDDYNKQDMNDNMYKMMRYMRNSMQNDHISESEAKHIVSEMYHMENGKKHSGEKFDIYKAKEICDKYRGILPQSTKPTDVYVAINAQYHDYSELFKNWFGNNIEHKIIESAIVFWFKDVDYKSGNKVVEYFKEN